MHIGYDAQGSLAYCYSPTEGLLVVTDEADGSKLLSWYAKGQFHRNGDDEFVPTGTPFKTAAYRKTRRNGVTTTTVVRTQTGFPAHSISRSVDGPMVTITQGEGAEALIRVYLTQDLADGMRERIESLYRGSVESTPASCTRELLLRTEGGWLRQSLTEGYGTPLARTTSYSYNEAFQVSRIDYPHGGYATYEYDALNRCTRETSPWGAGGQKVILRTYDEASPRFYDTRPIKVETLYAQAGAEPQLFQTVEYVYETEGDVQRTTTTTRAAGVEEAQVAVEETFTNSTEYAYAAGKLRFEQDAAGLQTWHEYAATQEHGAAHKHTLTTKVDGVLLAAHSRLREEFIAADDTVAFEQESIWDGADWQLLSSAAYEYDAQRRLVKTTRGNGRVSSAVWMCAGKFSETDEDGVSSTYGYTPAHQLEEVIREEVLAEDGSRITPESITSHTRDAADRVLSTRTDVGPMSSTETQQYDALGREISRTDALGRTTTTTYSADGLTTTVTTPAGATLMTTKHADGSLAAEGGTGQRAL
ncbi:MAG: RHS repeat protein, partial [Akkermansia sp.]|nr:RHS repeat protein [Akkermansia sp.]